MNKFFRISFYYIITILLLLTIIQNSNNMKVHAQALSQNSIDIIKLTNNDHITITSKIHPSPYSGMDLINPVITINNKILNYVDAQEASDNFDIDNNFMGFSLTVKYPTAPEGYKVIRFDSGVNIDTTKNDPIGNNTEYKSAGKSSDYMDMEFGDRIIDFKNVVMNVKLNQDKTNGTLIIHN